MRIDIITAVPSLFEGPLSASIVKRAIDKGFVEIVIHDLRDYSTNKYRQIDDYQFGGGAGMVMMAEPISKCIDKLQDERKYDEIIYVTPDGKTYNQQCANMLSLDENLIILAGHYKGVDQRIRDIYVTKEISVGDFVLSGGEMPAAIIADSIIRLIPGVLGDETSALSDSFQDNLLAPPVFTRPSEFRGNKVPEVLMSGDHKKIENWRHEEALKRTQERRPDLLE
jgi:tRNA (guanine37-N1)-methyltransferase